MGVARLAEGSRLGEVPDGPNTAQESRYVPSVIHKAILAAVSVGERMLTLGMEQVLRRTWGPSFQRVQMNSAEGYCLGGKPSFMRQHPLSPVAQAPEQT